MANVFYSTFSNFYTFSTFFTFFIVFKKKFLERFLHLCGEWWQRQQICIICMYAAHCYYLSVGISICLSLSVSLCLYVWMTAKTMTICFTLLISMSVSTFLFLHIAQTVVNALLVRCFGVVGHEPKKIWPLVWIILWILDRPKFLAISA